MTLEPTPSQTVGPYHHFALPYPGGERLVPPSDPDAVRIIGAVVDGEGQPVSDALIEIWQANRAGRYAHPEPMVCRPVREQAVAALEWAREALLTGARSSR
jgi:protocatechuate 3,4-dioxygenase, alpha subunit